MSVILYTTLGVKDLGAAAAFYDALFAILGWPRAVDTTELYITWGPDYDGGASFCICQPFDGEAPSAGNGTMVALRAQTRDQVTAFHTAALAQGGSSEGAPGLRPHYGENFFAAYVRDLDGNKLACVCHRPPTPERQ